MRLGLALPQSWTAYPLGMISLILAVSISFVVRFLVNLIAFWTFDVRGFVGLYLVVVGPLCGLLVPVHLFTEWLRIIRRERLRKLRLGTRTAGMAPLITFWLTDAEAVTTGLVGVLASGF